MEPPLESMRSIWPSIDLMDGDSGGLLYPKRRSDFGSCDSHLLTSRPFLYTIHFSFEASFLFSPIHRMIEWFSLDYFLVPDEWEKSLL